MKVQLIDYVILDGYNSEYYNDFDKILEILKSSLGPLEFQASFNYGVDIDDVERFFIFKNLVESSDDFRKVYAGPTFQDSDFVIVLSHITAKDKEFISYYDEAFTDRNIICNIGDREIFGGDNSKYLITFEIVAGILRVLMKFKDEHRHQDNRGCINDFCLTTEDRIRQIKTGDICSNCLDQINREKVDAGILNQVVDVINSLRQHLLVSVRYLEDNSPSVVIDSNGNVLVGSRVMDMDYMSMTLFVFFLTHIEDRGFSQKDLYEHKMGLLDIYTQIRRGIGRDEALIKIEGFIKNPKRFYSYVSRLNDEIKENLGRIIGERFMLEAKKKSGYGINYPRELITNNFKMQ